MSTSLFECLDLYESGAQSRVDRDNGVIRGVKILGWKSANGREYLPSGVNPQLYEGRVVNANHQKNGQDRSAYDRLGRVTNIARREDGLYGDLEVLTSHPLANPLFEAAERMPGIFGLSHTARGKTRSGRSGCVVESIEEVQSVDLVGDPATVSGLYESRSSKIMKLSDLMESLKKSRPGYSRALTEMAEAGIMDPGATMPEPAPEAEAGDESVDHCQAILDACKACLDDSSLDGAAKMAKIKKLLGILETGSGTETETAETETETETDEAAREESRKQKARLNLLEAKERLRDAADEAGVKLPKTLLESVNPSITAAQAKALVSELRGTTSASRSPKSAAPIAATGKQTGKTATVQESRETVPSGDGKTVARWLNGK